ncbi:sensor domain-containing diguanylate cyclase [Undibacterium sp. Jales W-56]|uniref:sensor domain-containing diguanylate cyclase n=1 Tax=Undibacterium sp. Jales W-56 TaxID=2897325 RepID=UPI0021D040DC|nr:sensor domain-containing diguanylate cyclase [Undibacterium sp. Jales W-56]MCU6435415.1 sensor domain-containing diguanylate cyclase [Undibacterium sp. Jales W-56]
MLQRLRTSIVYRSAFIVLSISLLVGSFFAVFTYYWTSHVEQERANSRMGELLSTVESTTSIACYLADMNLASEVSRGLLKNEDVESIRIFSGSGILAHMSKHVGAKEVKSGNTIVIPDKAAPTMRDVFSPFNAKEKVCQIELEPNLLFIRQQVDDKARFIGYLLMLQALLMACAVVYIVLTTITRPIKTISDQLHGLTPEAGVKLALPTGNEKDEIGQLVRDVNHIVGKFVHILDEERQLRIKHEIGEKKFQTIFNNAETGIFLLKTSGEVISYNHAFLRLLAIDENTSADRVNTALTNALEGQELRLHLMIDKATTQDQVLSEDFSIEVGQPPQRKWLHVVMSPVEEGVLQGLLNDITDRKSGEEEANQLAVTDHLTGTFNRLGFDKEITRLKHEMQRGNVTGFFLLLIDLDKFKEVNDRYGHDIGDQVLCHFTQIVSRVLRKSDFIARLGGDEFILLLQDLQQLDKAKEIAQKIIDQTSAPLLLNNAIQVQIGASIGATYVAHAGFDKNEIIREADEAMYAVKKSGKNNFRMHQS